MKLNPTPARKFARTLRVEPLEDRRLLAIATLAPVADTFTQAGVNAGSAVVLDLLDNNGANDRSAYVRFDLSGLNIDAITSATLTFYKTGGTRNDVINTDRFDVYGLPSLAGNTTQNWSETTLANGGLGAEYTNVSGNGFDFTRLVNLNQETGASVVELVQNTNDTPQSVSGSGVVSFLTSRIDDNGLATFVVQMDAGAVRGYGFHSREAASAALRPTLSIEYSEGVPEPETTPRRQLEELDRGLVAVRRSTTQAYIGWRLLASDAAGTTFNLYRSANGGGAVKLNATPLATTTDFVDSTANFALTNTYYVRAIVGGVEQPPSETFTLAANTVIATYLNVPLQVPAARAVVFPVGVTPPAGDHTYTYTANDASVGDLDGDGEYEIILKWDPTNANGEGSSKDNSQSGFTGNVLIDAYRLNGQLLWRIDLGRNIRAGAHYTQFQVYDLDGDGRAEVAMKTAPGTIDGAGNAVLMGSDVVTADYRNSSGYILTGPEYLTVFDGLTGAALDTVAFEPARGTASQWGDTYGNRVDRFTAGVAYLDGQKPSLVFGRGYYGPQSSGGQSRNEVAAYDFRDGELALRWHFRAGLNINGNINVDYIGQGAHSLTIGDVDADGRDEIIYGASAIDDNGLGLYTTTLGHGDALHMSDMDPSRPGLEIFMVHESESSYDGHGGEFRDADTGELIFGIPSTGDVGRGVAADIDPNSPGYEMWALTSDPNGGLRYVYSAAGTQLYEVPGNMFTNFVVWWDADLTRELLDGTTISEWNNPGRSNFDLDPSIGGTQQFAPNASSNNSTKSTPALVADILGDWREEVIWRRSDNTALEIFTTSIAATSRLTTLMHDTQYRTAIAWQNTGYNQPPHPSFFLGAGMTAPPTPAYYYAGTLAGDYNVDGSVDAADYTLWRDSLGLLGNQAADGNYDGIVDDDDLAVWRANFGKTQPAAASAIALAVVAAADEGQTAALISGFIVDLANSDTVRARESHAVPESVEASEETGGAPQPLATLLSPAVRGMMSESEDLSNDSNIEAAEFYDLVFADYFAGEFDVDFAWI